VRSLAWLLACRGSVTAVRHRLPRASARSRVSFRWARIPGGLVAEWLQGSLADPLAKQLRFARAGSGGCSAAPVGCEGDASARDPAAGLLRSPRWV